MVLTGGYAGIDIDKCIDPNTGEVPDWVREILKITDSYYEVSPSGAGLHIIMKVSNLKRLHEYRSRDASKGLEFYYQSRYFTLTGNTANGALKAIREDDEALKSVLDKHLTKNPKPVTPETPGPEGGNDLSTDQIIEIAEKSKTGSRFQSFMRGGWENQYGSQSEADMAFCNDLAFWCAKDESKMDDIFRQSALMRQKWERPQNGFTYGAEQIQKAAAECRNVYSPQQEFQVNVNDSQALQTILNQRRQEELEAMEVQWENEGSRGRKPIVIPPLRCAGILQEHIEFILFDLEENTKVAMYQPGEGIYTRNTTLIKRVISWLEPRLNNNKAEEVIYHLTNRAEIRERTESRYLLPVKNGVFNLRKKQLEPFNPKHVFTTKISTPYTENPKAPNLEGWNVEDWLSSIACHDKEIVHLLWQVINDSLNGNYSRKKAIFLIGEGNNGKGTFQELITHLIGLNNIATLKVNEFDERFRLSVLEGKTAVIGDDVPAGVYIDDSSNFNSVVTGDVVSVEQKNKPIYNTSFKCSVIQSTNGMPKFRNKTTGTIRRLVIVPFNADFNGQAEDTRIKDEFIKDPAVLEYVLHQAVHMDFEKFDIPQASVNELEVFKQDNDPVLDFKLSVFDEWDVQKVPKYVVYGFYKQFCLDNGYKPLAERQFHKQFKNYLGGEWDTQAQGRYSYEALLKELGDLDVLGIGFPDKNKNQKSYEKPKK
ncbi:DNA primase [Alkalicoccus urumqiensis]|uniref:DNA primase n=2 Tax=Alkalicoccus urumqiensis TaxID=1548213 RepID=A0A2P6MEC9_ALKUR|nr:DNA primase [Alkalicoccus urumqiensis]